MFSVITVCTIFLHRELSITLCIVRVILWFRIRVVYCAVKIDIGNVFQPL